MARESGEWKLNLSIDIDSLFASDLLDIARHIENGFTSGVIYETPRMTLFDALENWYGDNRLYYTGSIFGTPDCDTILVGKKWVATIKDMFGSDPKSFQWIDNPSSRRYDGYFLDGCTIFWMGSGIKEPVFEILD